VSYPIIIAYFILITPIGEFFGRIIGIILSWPLSSILKCNNAPPEDAHETMRFNIVAQVWNLSPVCTVKWNEYLWHFTHSMFVGIGTSFTGCLAFYFLNQKITHTIPLIYAGKELLALFQPDKVASRKIVSLLVGYFIGFLLALYIFN
jgi:hypothetical protein